MVFSVERERHRLRAATLALPHAAGAGRSLYERSDGIAADQSAQGPAASAGAVRGDELGFAAKSLTAKNP
jgi:hypothetical protein